MDILPCFSSLSGDGTGGNDVKFKNLLTSQLKKTFGGDSLVIVTLLFSVILLSLFSDDDVSDPSVSWDRTSSIEANNFSFKMYFVSSKPNAKPKRIFKALLS